MSPCSKAWDLESPLATLSFSSFLLMPCTDLRLKPCELLSKFHALAPRMKHLHDRAYECIVADACYISM